MKTLKDLYNEYDAELEINGSVEPLIYFKCLKCGDVKENSEFDREIKEYPYNQIKQTAIEQVKSLNKILTMVPSITVNLGGDAVNKRNYVSIYPMIKYSTRKCRDLEAYINKTGKTKNEVLIELKNMISDYESKRSEQEKLLNSFGLEREYCEGFETFDHVIHIRDYIIRFNNLTEVDLE